MRKRWIYLLMMALLLVGYGLGKQVQASDPLPGSDQDPLVTKSYVDNYIGSHYTDLQQQIALLTQQVIKLDQRIAVLQKQIKTEIKLVIGQKTAYIGDEAKTLPVAPYVEGPGHTMLPFRFIGEVLGADIGWESSSQTVSYQLGDKEMQLQIGSKTATIDGQEIQLDAAPALKGAHTVVPVRVVSEGLGAEVTWDESTQTVTIIP